MKYSVKTYLIENKDWWVTKKDLSNLKQKDEFEARDLYDRMLKMFQDKDWTTPSNMTWWLKKAESLDRMRNPKGRG